MSQTAKQQRYRERKPDRPVLGLLAERYSRHYLEFTPTGDTTRSELAEEFFENARKAAERYVEAERWSRPDVWNDWTRDPESRHWMETHLDHRRAWAKAIDVLWHFSDGQDVDADALQEALVRYSLRRHREGRRGRNQEHIFVKAAGIVREKAGIERMSEARFEAVQADYI